MAALEAAARSPAPAAACAGDAARGEGSPRPPPAPATPAAADGLNEELVLVISAAIAAFLGKKPHIRQIRLIGSAAWAQQGRVTIQASHALSVPFGEELALKLKITVDGKLYEVDVEVSEPEQPQPGFYPPPGHARVPAAAPVAAPPVPSAARRRPGGRREQGLPQPVLRHRLQDLRPGRADHPGQRRLLVLEAMKMETVITAPIAGKVAKINVNVGDAVQQGQVLVEFE